MRREIVDRLQGIRKGIAATLAFEVQLSRLCDGHATRQTFFIRPRLELHPSHTVNTIFFRVLRGYVSVLSLFSLFGNDVRTTCAINLWSIRSIMKHVSRSLRLKQKAKVSQVCCSENAKPSPLIFVVSIFSFWCLYFGGPLDHFIHLQLCVVFHVRR